MKKLLLLISLLLVTSFACAISPLPVSNSKNYATAKTANKIVEFVSIPDEVTVTSTAVNIRDLQGNKTGEFALFGQTLHGHVEGNWFILESKGIEWGKVWVGCVSVTSIYKCEAE